MENTYYEHGYALFIGIRYGHWTNQRPLNGTLNDVDDLNAHFLDAKKAAFNPKNIILLKEEDATREGIEVSFQSLASKIKSDPKASVFVYFTGHGKSHKGNFFLIPYDFSIEQLENNITDSNALLANDFANYVQSLTAKKCLVVLDCCHAEGMLANKKGVAFSNFLDGFVDTVNKSIQNDISTELNKGSGTIILTSCESHEESLDVGSNGLFTQVLLECLNGQDNLKKDGWVRLIDVMDYVPKTVKQRALQHRHSQSPMFKKIENLKADDFKICAYDIARVKGLNTTTASSVTNSLNKNGLCELLDRGLIDQVFEQLDSRNITQKVQYNRLKREFIAGLTGITLMDFTDRLKVFIGQL